MVFDAKPAIIGHRGCGTGTTAPPRAACRTVPGATVPGTAVPGAQEQAASTVAENTLASLLAATEAGLSWVEIDVQRTADEELVLGDDPTVPDGTFLIDGTAAGSGLPRLEEVFDALPPEVAVD